MGSKFIATTFFALAAITAGSASAQTIRPGLWQIETTIDGKPKESRPIAENIAAIRKRMENMEPQQRKNTEAMLADWAASGMEDTPQGSRMKLCITKGDLENFMMLPKKTDNGCTRKTSFVKGKEMRVNMQCGESRVSTDAVLKLQGDQAFGFQATTTHKGVDGKPVRQKSSGTAKWLGGDCGKIKPSPQEN